MVGTALSDRVPDSLREHTIEADPSFGSITRAGTSASPAATPGLVVRPAVLDDAAAIHAVHVAAVRGRCGGHYTPDQIEAWIGHRHPPQYAAAIALGPTPTGSQSATAGLAGFAALCRDELLALYVKPGSATGSGTALLRAVEDAARRGGVRRLRLSASVNAVAFYARHRYRAVTPLDLVVNGVAMPGMLMEKRLDRIRVTSRDGLHRRGWFRP